MISYRRYSRSLSFHFELKLNFLDFYEKSLCENKKVSLSYFDAQENPWIYLKVFREKKIKAIWAVLGYSKPKIFFLGQPSWSTFFEDIVPAFPQLL